MIDLSKFVDKEVVVTFRDNFIREGFIRKYENDESKPAPYNFAFSFIENTFSWFYTQNGQYTSYEGHIRDIVDIKLKQQKTMALSDKTIERLAEALAPEAVEYIQQSGEYLQFMTEQLTQFLKERMGEMDNEVAVEIIGIIFADNMNLCARKPVL